MQSFQSSKIVVTILTIFLLISACQKGENGNRAIITDDDKVSYCIGYSIGKQISQNLKISYIEVDPDIFSRAIKDVLADNPSVISETEIAQIMESFQQNHEEEFQKKVKQNLADGSAFIANNAKEEGVITLPDSLQYKIIKEGTGTTPKATDSVKVNYRGTLIDGTEFDNSYTRNEPAVFQVNRVIPGWTEVLQLMKTGAHWKVFIPPQLAYKERGSGNIPPNSVLIFDIELLEIVE